MDKKLKFAFLFLILFALVAVGLTFYYSESIAILSPKGLIAQKQHALLQISTWVMLLVVIPVFILTVFVTWKYRAENKAAKHDPDWDHSYLAEAVWWGFPLIIIVILGGLTWRACHELDPFKPLVSDVKPVRVQAVALQWKWLFIYPDQKIATLNYVELPEKTPINFEIAADAPMNSLWIPELGGQVYAMAGMKSKLHLIANEVGDFRGSSSNISGVGFSGMNFIAKVRTQEEFDQWAQSARREVDLTESVYNELVKPTSYVLPATYSLSDEALFDRIVMKYMMPEGKEMNHARTH